METYNNAIINVKTGSTLSEITEQALNYFGNLNDVWVITHQNHYRGNSTGIIFEITKGTPFEFNWHTDYEDRGIIEAIFVKDADLVATLKKRVRMVDLLRKLEFETSKYSKNYPIFTDLLIDGRWSVNNPKFINAEETNLKNAKQRNVFQNRFNNIISCLKKELKETSNNGFYSTSKYVVTSN